MDEAKKRLFEDGLDILSRFIDDAKAKKLDVDVKYANTIGEKVNILVEQLRDAAFAKHWSEYLDKGDLSDVTLIIHNNNFNKKTTR